MPTYQIWYMRPEYFRDGIMGYDFCKEKGRLPNPKNLEKTHILLMEVTLKQDMHLEAIWMMMQGENWSPQGEAQPLIRSKGLKHTSMSMGDIVAVNGQTHMADRIGFKLLGDKDATAKTVHA